MLVNDVNEFEFREHHKNKKNYEKNYDNKALAVIIVLLIVLLILMMRHGQIDGERSEAQ